MRQSGTARCEGAALQNNKAPCVRGNISETLFCIGSFVRLLAVLKLTASDGNLVLSRRRLRRRHQRDPTSGADTQHGRPPKKLAQLWFCRRMENCQTELAPPPANVRRVASRTRALLVSLKRLETYLLALLDTIMSSAVKPPGVWLAAPRFTGVLANVGGNLPGRRAGTRRASGWYSSAGRSDRMHIAIESPCLDILLGRCRYPRRRRTIAIVSLVDGCKSMQEVCTRVRQLAPAFLLLHLRLRLGGAVFSRESVLARKAVLARGAELLLHLEGAVVHQRCCALGVGCKR